MAVIGGVLVGVIGAFAQVQPLIFGAIVGVLFLVGRWIDSVQLRDNHKFELGHAENEIRRLRAELDEEISRRKDADKALREFRSN